MSRPIILCVTLSFLACELMSAEPRERPTEQLRVLTYNIHHGAGVDGKLDLKRIAAVINAVRPDLVALQEVDQGVARSNHTDQPAELARLTKMRVAFGDNIRLGDGKYGNAILSRFPLAEQQNSPLPNVDRGEQRGVLSAAVCWTKPLTFFATHLDHRRDDRERFASARAINQLVAQHPDRLAILAGDLNDTLDSRTLCELGTVWNSVNEDPLPTIPVNRPRRQIDFILFRPVERWKTIEVRVLAEATASDHRALLAILEIRQPTSN